VSLVPGFDLLRTNYLTPSRADLVVETARENAPPLSAHVDRLRALARQYGFRTVVTPVPPRRHPRASRRIFERALGPDALAALDVVDVREGMAAAVAREGRQWTDLYWEYDDHFDADGYGLFGASLAPEIGRRARDRARSGPSLHPPDPAMGPRREEIRQ
jgi:hypothetical protein